MRWIDEAGYVGATQYSAGPASRRTPAGSGSTGPSRSDRSSRSRPGCCTPGAAACSFSVHVSAADTDAEKGRLAAHALVVFAGFGDAGKRAVTSWVPKSAEDRELLQHAERLIMLRDQAGSFTSSSSGV